MMTREQPTAIDYSWQQGNNTFAKILRDYRRIEHAIENGIPLSALTDIKFIPFIPTPPKRQSE
ncbi:hypothetical protein [Chitinophaga alhagiae]|uniref:hypothetical protein n=1 Tax=Chitinophaga alhagiae TaxID=2203219 RepID=UPI001300AE08|nr:hypothetical protein [Chitinophaga alhagiae]